MSQIEKWEIVEDSLFKVETPFSEQWFCTIAVNGSGALTNKICEVQAETREECIERAELICKVPEMVDKIGRLQAKNS